MKKNNASRFEDSIDQLRYFFENLKNLKFSFSQLKTSTQISLKFTLFTMLQVLLFSILANGIFFENWYSRQQGQIPPGARPMIVQKIILGKNRVPEVDVFDIDSPE
ncbi:TPA: hypothetical protein DCZ39_01660 [Patescibacteria group bacterium]|nr:hypothetical protein [Candidatus Gracilibacteria bacterium]